MAYVSWTSKFGTTTSTSDVLITGTDEVEITADTVVRNVDITVGGKLRLAPGASIKLTVHGNLHATGTPGAAPDGTLFQSRPALGQTHTVEFAAVNEAAFVGTSSPTDHSFKASDRGLWIMHGAAIDVGDARGRTPWTRLAGAASAGATTITLEAAPTAWQVGDRIVVMPTVSPATNPSNYWDAYDERTITAIDGASVTLSSALTYAHPTVASDPDVTPTGWTQPTSWAAEVANLTRDVKLQGTPTGRAHVMVHSTAVQYLKNVEIRYMGPQKQLNATQKVGLEGRYALHMHHGLYNAGYAEGARHTTENIAISQAGFRGFVIHNTHGVTLEKCVAHDLEGQAFWWDVNGAALDTTTGNETNDLTWNACLGSKVRGTQGVQAYRLSVFSLADGENITVQDCVAVGENGALDSAGFLWPEGALSTWTFRRNLSHNLRHDGIFVWQNTQNLHVIDDFTAYWCERGIDHGAYSTSYTYNRALLVGCHQTGVMLHSSSTAALRQTFNNVGIDAKALGKHALIFLHPNLPPATDSDLRYWKIKALKTVNTTTGEGYAIKVENGVGIDPNIAYLRDWSFLDSTVTMDSLVFWTGQYLFDDRLKLRNFTVGGTNQGFFDVLHPSHPDGVAVTSWNGAKRVTLTVDDFGQNSDGSTQKFLEKYDTARASGWGPSWVESGKSGSVALSVVDGYGLVTLGDAFNTRVTLTPASPGVNGTADEQISGVVDYTGKGTTGSALLHVRLRANGGDYYELRLSNAAQTGVRIYAFQGGTQVATSGQWNQPAAPASGVRIRWKLRVEAGVVKARTWLDGTDEPSVWNGTYTPTSLLTGGSPQVYFARGSGGHSMRVDDIRVADFRPPAPPPVLRLVPDPTSLSFSPTSLSRTLGITQTDTGPAATVEVLAAPGWLSVAPTSLTAPGSFTLTVVEAQAPATAITERLFLVSQTHGTIEVPASYQPGAALTVSPTSLRILPESTTTVTVGTTGAAVTVTPTGVPSYLTVTPTSATTPATFAITASTMAAYDEGDYTSTLLFTAPGQSSTPLPVTVEVYESGLHVYDHDLGKWVLTRGSLVKTTDPRLFDARVPLAHEHGATTSTAEGVTFTPAGSLAATDVQAAIVELDTEKAPSGHTHSAPAASAVAFTPTGTVAATDVQAAIAEVASEAAPSGHTHTAPTASTVAFTPAGAVAATDVQAAIVELDTEKSPTGHAHAAQGVSVQDENGTALTGITTLDFQGAGVAAAAGAAGEVIVTIPGATAAVDVQTFTADGTWTKPAGATRVRVMLWGGGAGGGSGRRGAAGSARSGGGGGGGGGFTDYTFLASDLGATVAVTVGLGGAGGASITTDDTNGAVGGAGGATIFGALARATGGTATAAAGTTAPTTSTTGQGGTGITTTGGVAAIFSLSNTNAVTPTATYAATAGGHGGQLTTGNSAGAGGPGGTNAMTNTAGGTAGNPGNTGTATITGGTGGGGGAAFTGATSSAGGAGGPYGGGGGGGGASANGFASGAGAAGGDGRAVIMSF